MRSRQRHAALRGDQAVFHRVGHAHAGVEPDDARRALERMRRAHARLQVLGGGRVALQRQQPGVEDFGLRFGLEREQLEQRGVAQLFGVHARLRASAWRSRAASSRPMLRPWSRNSACV
ncbi:hypothetical protein D9M69_421190 [compost metagenome]